MGDHASSGKDSRGNVLSREAATSGGSYRPGKSNRERAARPTRISMRVGLIVLSQEILAVVVAVWGPDHRVDVLMIRGCGIEMLQTDR